MNRFIINQLSYVAPRISARLSYYVWTKTHRPQRPRREAACYAAAKRRLMSINNQRIVVYQWGTGARILLLHGWNGRATQFFQVIDGLVANGYEVIAFDQPGFGESEGEHSGLLPICAAIHEIASEHGPFTAIVGHSFGWLAAINAEPASISGCLIGIAPPADFNWLIEGFGYQYQLNAHATDALKKYVVEKYRLNSLDEISIEKIGPQLKLPGLIIYDQLDDKVPRAEIDKIMKAWPQARLYITQGLGHTRLMYDKAVATTIADFITQNNS